MEAKNVKIIAAVVAVIILIVVIIILWHSLGDSKTFFVLAGIGIALIIVILIWVLIQHVPVVLRQSSSMVRRSRSALEGEELRLEYSFLRKATGLPTRFHYESLEAATDKFRVLIGRGSSASVFKGTLDNGAPVAVKRVDSEHSDREFRSEVAAIGRVQHANLVHLFGYCIVPKSRVRFLVYEFADNGSLDEWIFPVRGPGPGQTKCLPWPLRYQVAVDVAKALAYLHQDCRSRVLHLDIKPENILLDSSFRALVSDFGLSKLMGKDESRIVTTVRGTRGYLAPEWLVGSGASEKCDVFSYGIVLLELVAGRRSIRLTGERRWSYLPRVATDMVVQGKVMEVADERVRGEAEESEVKALVYVALWCVREDAKVRPSMARVVDMLQGRADVEVPPPEAEMLVVDLLNMEYNPTAAGPGVLRRSDSEMPVPSLCYCSSSILSGR